MFDIGWPQHRHGLEVVPSRRQRDVGSDATAKGQLGYDIKQLFIGAEGTLGIVIRADICVGRKPINA